jgi:hypothetical protein
MKLPCYALMLLTMGVVGLARGATASAPALRTLAESRESIWNAVAIDSRGHIYVAGPRWTGSRGPSVAVLDATGQPQPYPAQGSRCVCNSASERDASSSQRVAIRHQGPSSAATTNQRADFR